MSAEVELISTMTERKPWTRPPIQMEFQVVKDLILAYYFCHDASTDVLSTVA